MPRIDRYFVVTGAPGSGKTPVIAELVRLGYRSVPEPAREVLAEQRSSGGRGVPELDRSLFCDLMLARAISDFGSQSDGAEPVFFDRGLPDLLVYAEIFGLDPAPAAEAAWARRYNDDVFVFPSWPEIYTTDDERKMTFDQADAFGRRIAEVYETLGYRLVHVPRARPRHRASFIAEHVAALRE